jgi:hypothetical protein
MHADPAMPVEDEPQAMQPTAVTMDDQPQADPTPGNIPQPATTNAQFAVNGVHTQPNGLCRTVAPTGGFPVPQLGESVWRNLPAKTKQQWHGKPGPKLWVRLYCTRYTDDLSAEATHIREVIKCIVNAPNVLVSTPIAKVHPSGPFSAPWHFLVSGMMQNTTDCLVGLQMVATDAAIIFTLPFNKPLPLYIGTLKGYLLDISPKESTIVADAIQATLIASPKIGAFAHARLSASDAGAVAAAYRSICVHGFKVKKSDTELHNMWNVYCDCPPQMSFDACLQWVKLIKNFMFPTEDHGVGTMCNVTDRGTDQQFLCLGCKSADHPTGLCPFPSLPGWIGPAHTSEDQSHHANDDTPAPPPPRGQGRGSY